MECATDNYTYTVVDNLEVYSVIVVPIIHVHPYANNVMFALFDPLCPHKQENTVSLNVS